VCKERYRKALDRAYDTTGSRSQKQEWFSPDTYSWGRAVNKLECREKVPLRGLEPRLAA
jgi:hypothetical protein